ncbi:natterin-3-like [Mya arenaria]|uniref:natterin-3-like n=1 Tax=Mya arenaria TaxID=6604 RepID=UPI0022E72539|nr:natterin-3-like [Mya arenaria]
MAEWQSTSGGDIPDNAVRAGYEENGQPLFIARAEMEDGVKTPGKAGPKLSGAHIPWGNKEVVVENYEILVHSPNSVGYYEWLPCSGGDVPENAFKTSDGIYIGRCHYEGGLVPGKVSTSHGCAYISYGGEEEELPEYQVLCRIK